ncbi:TATA box-binding protein-associated factor RNA polymerase I subunit D [Sceloporus undulatus]|uniref:TATA box-binding protein-associated factor RNA polymerase I subunit D n=1 Tax=Sceloporus undulatus TaxID=8520 RepID=UPI001C4CAD65|nr:TATA box-binding protein-associated factor RNA polymerase I subunit D [Sceloporus undulatus]XP_042312805.1 TATA box-binding protein-associated factor RNA polymerase I subunit D [Sceloporus undulatus]XP_042312806.1 TATA box-binding protein-associated factor RNA polymerase I subunit D [Sceloporus undulatus]XP_042312807.1 TATA box-binding protein-associated factor RNA polymerase I subunit D [Sceloporus undulatus]
MADIAETEDSALDCDEDSDQGPSQGLPQLEVCSAASFPDHQVSKKRNSGLCSLKQSRRKAKKARCGPSSENTVGGRTLGVSSTGSVKSKSCLKLPKPKIDVRAFFDYYFVRKQHRKKRWRTKRWWLYEKETTTCRKQRKRRKSPKGQYPKISVIERKKRYRDRGLHFPFLEKLCGRRYLPFKYVHRYEQAALQGYLRYVEALKCEQHLKKSLTKLNAVDDLENESLESRKYKYLDDDGSLSPIEETSEEDQNKNSSNDDIGARIVEISSFVLSSKIPEKKKKTNNKSR